MPDMMTVAEAASVLGITTNAAYVSIGAGLIPIVKVTPRTYRVPKSQFKQKFGLID
jgi:excisionase family DNA binding protein